MYGRSWLESITLHPLLGKYSLWKNAKKDKKIVITTELKNEGTKVCIMIKEDEY